MKLRNEYETPLNDSISSNKNNVSFKKENKFFKPSRDEAEEAVKTLIRWAGDNPSREGLKNTPSRVVKAYEEFYSGYNSNPKEILSTTFSEVSGYDEIIILKNIDFHSHCEHHMVPIIGKVNIAYLPKNRVVGISKIARTVEIFCKRLQTQETMTAQIANTIQKYLEPKGVAIHVSSNHHCMTSRGVKKNDTSMITTFFTGIFKEKKSFRNRFFVQIKL